MRYLIQTTLILLQNQYNTIRFAKAIPDWLYILDERRFIMIDKILLIGNGFDLYHKLPTRYKDFLFFCDNWNTFVSEYRKKEFISLDKSSNDKTYIDIRLANNGELFSESLLDFAHYDIYDMKHIGYLYNHITNNGWIEYFRKITITGEGWIDFESEIQKALEIVEDYYYSFLPASIGKTPIISMTDSMKYVINTFSSYTEKNYIDLSKNLFNSRDNDPIKIKQNKKMLINAMYTELVIFSTCLNYYMSDFVTAIKCKYFSRQIKDLGNNLFLVSFNYTYTFANVYGKGEEFFHHPVHGESKENNIVLGISDDCFNNTNEYLYFQKFFQRIQKKTGNFYKELVKPLTHKSLNNSPLDLFIMGHSLDKVDKGILQDFFYNTERIGTIKIFYYNQKAYESIVINLIDMFGKDFVIDQTGKDRIVFEELKEKEPLV